MEITQPIQSPLARASRVTYPFRGSSEWERPPRSLALEAPRGRQSPENAPGPTSSHFIPKSYILGIQVGLCVTELFHG